MPAETLLLERPRGPPMAAVMVLFRMSNLAVPEMSTEPPPLKRKPPPRMLPP